MKHLDLFSGIGGFALAARWAGWQTVGFCEIDPWCQRVLAKNFPGVPIHDDIRTIEPVECDIITAGFPCQPYSYAGKRKGSRDDRDLWPETVRVIGAIHPQWVVLENVVGVIEMGLDDMLFELEAQDYSVFEPFIIPACAVNAPHRRDRVWIVAHSERDEQPRAKPRSRETGRVGRELQPMAWDRDWQDALAEFRIVDDGLPGRVVRYRTDAIRNSIVPQVAELIFKAIPM